MNTKLSDFINEELKQRGWSQRELARKAGVSHTSISEVIAGNRNPGWDFCAAIAAPLEKTPLEVFQLAGLLPSGGDIERSRAEYYANSLSVDEAQLLELYRKVKTQKERQIVLSIIWGLVQEGGGE
jgi:transcriptional regulator with XRE-family HTH domain